MFETDEGTYEVKVEGKESILVTGWARYGKCIDCAHAATIVRANGKLYRDCACTTTRIRKK